MNPNLRNPYDIFPALRRLKSESATMSPDERRRLMATVAINAADPAAVALAADLTGDDFAHIYPPDPEPQKVTTEGAIETFLDKFGNTSPEENALLERLIFNPVPDYSSVLAEQESPATAVTTDNDLDGLAAMASEINAPAPPKETHAEKHRAETRTSPRQSRNEPALTLELAKIFIRQQRFDRAHEIISKISLNNPEKSVYFANQLRFLEKLIKIQRLQSAEGEARR